MVVSGWRLVKRKYASGAFSGAGCDFTDGRWHSKGNRLVYTSESLSTAILELLAIGVEFVHLADQFVAFSFELEVDKITEWRAPHLESISALWRSPVPLAFTRQMGDAWIKSANSAVLRLPSAVVPVDENLLLNPIAVEFQKIKLSGPFEVPVDSRLLSRK